MIANIVKQCVHIYNKSLKNAEKKNFARVYISTKIKQYVQHVKTD